MSCNPNGSAPSYGATFTRSAVDGDNPAGTAPRPISENGQYVFFDTQESLLPADTNGRVDVYEWHESPVSHEGAIGLITTGQDTSDSFFLDSSPDGRNVFFGTHSRLVPADQDNQGNLYDARIKGGFPVPLGAGPCEGDACQNPSSAPVYQTPTSLSFSGAGDLSSEPQPSTSTVRKKAASKCVKPKRLSHGKCVKPKKKAKKAKKATRASRARDGGGRDDEYPYAFEARDPCSCVWRCSGGCFPLGAGGDGCPQWTVTAVSAPTNLVPGDETGNQYYNVVVTNTGGEPSSGPVTITDTLPEGVTLDEAGAEGFELINTGGERDSLGTPLSCEGVSCTFSGSVVPEEMLLMRVPVDVNLTGEQTVTNVVHVSGGGAPDVFVRTPTLVSHTPAGYGIPPGSTTISLSDSQAGAHADLTNTIGYNTVDGEGEDAGDQKEASVVLPPGFGGDLVDTPTCSVAKFSHEECPIGTQIGVATIFFEGLLGHERQHGAGVQPGGRARGCSEDRVPRRRWQPRTCRPI